MADGLDRTVSDEDAPQRAVDLLRQFGDQAPPQLQVSSDGNPGLPTGTAPELPAPTIPTDPGPRYSIHACLGRGGGGEVFAVDDRRLNRAVAVKVMHPQHQADARRTQRFLSEAQITASLQHPSVLPVYDLGAAADGRLWFSMRRASGPSLADLLARAVDGDLDERIRDPADRVGIGIRICECIAYAHDRGILHCDLKPGNILLGDYGEVLVVDWGTAAQGAAPGRITGTPLYMSPEQARGEPAGPRSDVFCIAATLWHLLTLKPPLSPDLDPIRFWELKRLGQIDPLPAEGATDIPASLADILRSAMDPDPERRPAGARAFCERLRSWLRQREVEAACDRITAELPTLTARGDHRSWQRAEDMLRQLLLSSPGHRRADELLGRVLAGHARHAISRRALDLAGDLLEEGRPGHAEVAAELAAARAARRRRTRLRWGLGIAALLAVATLAGIAWQQHRARFGTWTTVWTWQAGQTMDGIAPLPGFTISGSQPAIADAEGLCLPLGSLLRLPPEERGDVRMTIEAVWTDRVDGLELLLRVSPGRANTAWHAPLSQMCQFGGYNGTCTLIASNRTPGPMAVQAETVVDFQLNRPYVLEIELVGNHTTLRVDGRRVLDHEEPLPIGHEEARFAALRSWADGVRIRHVRIERLGLPPRPSPLVIGDTLMGSDLTGQAMDAYLRVARDQPGGALEEEALAKACIAACLDPARAAEAPAIAQRLLAAFPQSAWHDRVSESMILLDWLGGNQDAALAAAEALLAGNPQSRIADRLLRKRPPKIVPEMVPRLLALLGRTPSIESMDLGDLGITDISCLRGLQLRRLSAVNNRIRDISPLAGMPLRVLDLGYNRVQDISALAGMSLSRLSLNWNQVTDLRPLAGMPLSELVISNCPVSDIGPLAEIPLRIFTAFGTRIADLRPLPMKQLRTLDIGRAPVSNLAPLATALELRDLRATDCTVDSLAPLAACRQLDHLLLGTVANADLRPLAGLPLRSLVLGKCQISDLSPLRGMPLEDLRCQGAPISDLSPLTGMPLRTLLLSSSRVEDLAPLAGMRIHELNLGLCPLKDLTQLQQIEVKGLVIGGVRADLTPVASMPRLERIYLHDGDDPEHIAPLLDALRRQGRIRLTRQVEVQLATMAGDAQRLKPLARRIGQRLVVDTFLCVTYERAHELAERLGARLVCPEDASSQAAIIPEIESGATVWLGLRWDAAAGRLRGDGGAVPKELHISAFELDNVPQSVAWNWYVPERQTGWRPVPQAALASLRNYLVLEWDAW